MRKFLALCKVLKKINRLNYDEVDNYLSILYNTRSIKKVGIIGDINAFNTDSYLKYEITPILKDIEEFKYSHLSKKEKEYKIVDVRSTPKINRNSICECGSGKKYKKCHSGKEIK